MQHIVDATVSRLEAAEAAVVGGVDHGADGEVANIAAPHGELCGADGEPVRAWQACLGGYEPGRAAFGRVDRVDGGERSLATRLKARDQDVAENCACVLVVGLEAERQLLVVLDLAERAERGERELADVGHRVWKPSAACLRPPTCGREV